MIETQPSCWTAEDRGTVLDEAVEGLWRFVARHADRAPLALAVAASIVGMEPRALEFLSHLHFLLSLEVDVLIDEALPILLREARPRAFPRATPARGGPLRGPIMWGATAGARGRSGGEPDLYIVAAATREPMAPELVLLRAILETVVASSRAVEEAMPGTAPGWTARRAERMQDALGALGHPLLKGAEDASVEKAYATCLHSSRRAVQRLVRAYRRCRESRSPNGLKEVLREQALVPLDDDTLYEVWALVGLIEAFDMDGWVLERGGLIGRDPSPAQYRAPDGRHRAHVYVDHTPKRWRKGSRYRDLFVRYGVSGAVRRPDLVVEVEGASGRRCLLIEVKRTRDARYIADSVYKALGYVADFEDAFAEQEGTRALLLLWDGVSMPATSDLEERVILATYRTYRRRARALVAALR